MVRTRNCETMGFCFLMLGCVTLAVVTGMSVTDFTTVGHIALLLCSVVNTYLNDTFVPGRGRVDAGEGKGRCW